VKGLWLCHTLIVTGIIAVDLCAFAQMLLHRLAFRVTEVVLLFLFLWALF